MGRRKLEIKRIEDKSARQVTFSKRRNGLLKKAKELSVLCDLDIGVIIYSCRGKLYQYCSSNNSLTEILRRYNSLIEKDSSSSTEVCEAQDQYSKYSRFLTCKELLQIMERELEELSVTDFVHLEKQLEAALMQTRTTKTNLLLESISNLHEKEKKLEEEKVALEGKIAGSKTKKKKKKEINLNVIPEGRTPE